MAKGRIILKTISESKKLANLKTDGARLLYTWLIAHLDINGCFSADPDVVNGKILTRLGKTKKIVLEYLDDLESAGLIKRYEAKGDIFLIVPDFASKQPQLRPDREGKTTIPMPTPEQLQQKSAKVGKTPAQFKLIQVNLNQSNSNSVRFDYENRILTGLNDKDYEEWSEAFPAVNIKMDIKSACQWLIDNPAKRKKQVRRFLTNWLRRTQERGGNKAKQDGIAGKTKLWPIPGKTCSHEHCKMPACYKNAAGNYDWYYCAEHMPADVKKKYYG